MKRDGYPQIYKLPDSTHVSKVFPPETVIQMRNISFLLNFDKIMKRMISDLIISDINSSLDPSHTALPIYYMWKDSWSSPVPSAIAGLAEENVAKDLERIQMTAR